MSTGTRKPEINILDRKPPFDLDAEAGVVGSSVLDQRVIDDVALLVRPGDFHDDAHRLVYQELLTMHQSGKRIDMTLIVSSLKKSGVWELIGGAAFLARVCQSVPNSAHASYYAQVVREKAIMRELIDCSTETLRESYDDLSQPSEILERLESRLMAIALRSATSSPVEIRQLLMKSLDDISARMGNQSSIGVSTGFHDLDEMIGGLAPGSLNILAGRPSMGKTSMALNIAEYAALKGEVATLFVSLEMAAIELGNRLLSSHSGVSLHRMRAGTLAPQDRDRLMESAGELGQAQLFTLDQATIGVSEIAAHARHLKRKHNLGLVMVDYLQLVEPENSRDKREEQVAKLSRRLKGLARELEVPILCLAQLNRQAEASSDHRPRLSHLRESGAVEQDADVVMFVHRDEYYLAGEAKEQAAGQATIIVAKQRNGPVGDVELVWRKECARFCDKAPARLEVFDDYNQDNQGDEGF